MSDSLISEAFLCDSCSFLFMFFAVCQNYNAPHKNGLLILATRLCLCLETQLRELKPILFVTFQRTKGVGICSPFRTGGRQKLMITRVLCLLSTSGNWPMMSFLCSHSGSVKNQATSHSTRNRLRISKFWRLENWIGV